MAKIDALESLVLPLMDMPGIAAAVVSSRAGNGDILLAHAPDGMNRTLLGLLLSSLLLLGEQLAGELDGPVLDYQALDFGNSLALLFPCSEAVGLMLLVRGREHSDAAVAAGLAAAPDIGHLLRNKAAEFPAAPPD